MEDYERRKLYRVHLKNISEIKNCRTPINYTGYSSRLFNFSLKTTFKKRELRSLWNSNSQPKLTNDKKCEQKKVSDFFRVKQNQRLQNRLNKALGSINMNKYQRQYQQHKKIMKLHRKIKQSKRAILYKIYDITFKGISPNLKEEFIIYDLSRYDVEGFQNQLQEQQVLRGNIYELRNSIIKGFRDQKMIFRIVGRNQGIASIINGQRMVPIMYRKQIVGTLIVEVY